jgi:Outer membrane lipoprotein
MTGSESILNKEPEELGRLLLEAARQDSAPRAARERALLSVTSVALGMGVASSAAAYASPTSLVKASGWLVAKWLVTGLGSGILTIAVAQGVQQLATNHAQTAPAVGPSALMVATRVSPAGTVRERPLLEPQLELPAALPTTLASVTQSVPVASVASVTSGSGVVSAPQASTEPAVPALPSAEAAISPLTRELSLLEQARSALARHSAPQALQALNEYRSQFPSGSLQAEAAALRVEAVGQSGDRALAERLAASFLASYPTSPLSARVRALSDAFRSNTQEP